MDDGAIHAVENGLHHTRCHRDAAHRNEPPGQRLGHADHVRLHAPVLDGPELAGTANAALNFVGDQQGAVLGAEPRGLRQIVVAG